LTFEGKAENLWELRQRASVGAGRWGRDGCG
jgi:hypothetical protein